MEKSKKMVPYLVVNAVVFYLSPLLIVDTGSAMILLLIIVPAACLVTAVVFGARQAFWRLYPVAVAVLFLPTLLLFYNSTAAPYALWYGLTALVGMALGSLARWLVVDRRASV